MNYIRHLNAFYFGYAKRDRRLNANHISLYTALFQFWNVNRFQNPLSIAREAVMAICGIGSKNTYHKCLKDLHQFGYIFYQPSLCKFQKSTVSIVRLDQPSSEQHKQLGLFNSEHEFINEEKNEEAVSKSIQVAESDSASFNTDAVPKLITDGTNNDIDVVPKMGLLIKHKFSNNKESGENTLTQKLFSKNIKVQKAINNYSAGSKIVACPDKSSHNEFVSPTLDIVLSFFRTNSYHLTEAHKFFNHYCSNGWQVGGKSPMQNWQSSAHKWMLNAGNFQSIQNSKHGQQDDFDSGPGKVYSQPL